MDDPDPISQFFPDAEFVDLYEVLGLTSDTELSDIKKSYRKLALSYHPDKHQAASPEDQVANSLKFQQVGFAYAVLSDETRRTRYDSTGRTDEGFLEGVANSEGGWDAYFEAVFEKVSRDRLDEDKRIYQDSEEEKNDIIDAYNKFSGSLEQILNNIPHSTHDDEQRFVTLINSLISSGTLSSTPEWSKSSKDEKKRLDRKKAASKEAKEAEEAAKELGVWDEFYGSGKPTDRSKKKGKETSKNKGKGKGDGGDEPEGETEVQGGDADESVLQALIQRKSKKMDSFFDGLAAKYGAADAEEKGGRKRNAKGKKRAAAEQDPGDEAGSSSPKKKTRKASSNIPPPPDIDDAEFAALQARMFGDKSKGSKKVDETTVPSSGDGPRGRKTRGKTRG